MVVNLNKDEVKLFRLFLDFNVS